jgi:flagellar hook-associated protein 3 FlgL
MRTSFLSAGRESLANLRQVHARIQKATAEISTGLRVAKPSDSPTDAAIVVRTKAELAAIAQLRDNLGAVQAELRTADGALSDAGTVLTRAASLATQAANFTENASGREIIRGEIEGIIRHLVNLADTAHGDRYLFAGSADGKPPFEFDPADPLKVLYRGDAVGRSIAFPDGRAAQYSLTGDQIFGLPDFHQGLGRTPATAGAALPSPPVGIGISFEGGVDGVISVDLPGFFLAAAPPGVPAGGEQITVHFVSQNGQIDRTVTTAPLAGGETAAQIAAALNAAVAADPEITGGFTFSDEGGSLKLVQSDTLEVAFDFTSSATGGLTSGLEAGGVTGGYSAQEIAAELNAQVQANPALATAGIVFRAVDGEVQVDGEVDFTFTAVDFERGTGFLSGLAGTHNVGGGRSADIFGVLADLARNLSANDPGAILANANDLRRAVEHIGRSQGFYGSTLRQIELTLGNLTELDRINATLLSNHQDADLLEAVTNLQTSQAAEQASLAVLSRRRPTLLDFLA